MNIRVASRTIGMAIAFSALVNAAGPAAASAAAAAAHCFLPQEIEAQEAARYQVKLMVLSDTCGDTVYRRFTVRNRAEIVRYQDELIAHFRRTGAHNAERTFDDYLTSLANKISLDAGHTPLASLCSQSAQFLAEADHLDHEKFRHYIATRAAERKSAYPQCRG